MSNSSSTFLYEDAELVPGLVAPVGTNFDRFVESLRVCLKDFNYEAHVVRLSELASSFKVDAPEPAGSEELVRLTRLMNAGNSARMGARLRDRPCPALTDELHPARREGGRETRTSFEG